MEYESYRVARRRKNYDFAWIMFGYLRDTKFERIIFRRKENKSYVRVGITHRVDATSKLSILIHFILLSKTANELYTERTLI